MKHTHQEVAASLVRLLTETKVSIPFGMSKYAVEIQNWLVDIAEGRLIVIDPEETRLPGRPYEGDPEDRDGGFSDPGEAVDSDADT